MTKEEKTDKELYINFDEYVRQGEPEKREWAEAWRVAIGLQTVDGLKVVMEKRNMKARLSKEIKKPSKSYQIQYISVSSSIVLR